MLNGITICCNMASDYNECGTYERIQSLALCILKISYSQSIINVLDLFYIDYVIWIKGSAESK